jgi:hypothetical protein
LSAFARQAALQKQPQRKRHGIPKIHFPFQSIIATYLSVCRPYQLPAPWDHVAVDPLAFVGPTEPQAALAALTSQHAEEALIASRFVWKDAAGQLSLHPSLDVPDAAVILVCDSHTQALRDLVSGGGCILTPRPPVFEMLADKYTFTLLGSRHSLLATETLADAVLLRSLGIAAAPAIGMNRLNAEEVGLLEKYYGVLREPSEREKEEAELRQGDDADDDVGWEPEDYLEEPEELRPEDLEFSETAYILPRNGDSGAESDDHVSLIFVQWSPHSLSPERPRGIKQAIDYLHELADYRSLELMDVMEWAIDDRDLAAMQFSLARRETSWAKDVIFDSLFGKQQPIDLVQSTRAPAASADLAAELDRMNAAVFTDCTDTRSPEQRREIVRGYVHLAQKHFAFPLVREAQEASDPLEQSMWIQMAELQAAFLAKASAVREQWAGLPTLAPECSGRTDSVKEMLAISGRLLSLTKELSTCRQQRFPVAMGPQRPSMFDVSRRFGNWTWTGQN